MLKLFTLSVVLEKGEGAYLWDVDGNKYLDMVSAYSAVSHGHSHPELVKPARSVFKIGNNIKSLLY